jgi:hypothetical protein
MMTGNTDPLKTSEAAKAQLAATLKSVRGLRGYPDQNADNALIAQNVLLEDLGHFGPNTPKYSFDSETRDRLIAHARQDAAHALINTSTLLQEMQNEMRKLRRAISAMAFLVAAMFFLMLIMWWGK